MRVRAFSPMLAVLIAACATAPDAMSETAQAADASSGAPIMEDLDPFTMAIEAERYAYLIQLAREGAFEGGAPGKEEDGEWDRAAAGVHRAVQELYMLRDETCARGLAAAEECGALPPPDWFGEPVGAPVDAMEVRRRIDWLTDVMWPFVNAGCEAGEALNDEEGLPHYCSVE